MRCVSVRASRWLLLTPRARSYYAAAASLAVGIGCKRAGARGRERGRSRRRFLAQPPHTFHARSHAASSAVNSHASCRFTNATGVNIDGDCPPQCYLTLKAAWGDCYCLNPNFLPPGGDPPVANMTVKQVGLRSLFPAARLNLELLRSCSTLWPSSRLLPRRCSVARG